MLTEMIPVLCGKMGKTKRFLRGGYAGIFPAAVMCMAAHAEDITIDGGDSVSWNGVTNSCKKLYIGSTGGSGALSATDSEINIEEYVYFGYQDTADNITYCSTLALTNTSLTCDTFTLGFCVKGGAGARDGTERIQADIGRGSIVTVKAKMNRNCQPWSRVRFTGGRIVFSRSSSNPGTALCIVYGRDFNNNPYNNGITWEGVDAPVDIEVSKDALLATGWVNRNFVIEGNGGFVKRGAGVLTWGWRSSNGSDELLGNADYTGDTVIKAGGIRLDAPFKKADSTARYSIPKASPLKIEKGAFFDFAGNDAAWVSVSGEGIVTNSSSTAATLTLGAGGSDCSFEVSKAAGPIDVVKTGSGLLTVGVPEIEGSLTVSGGTLVVKSGTSLSVASISAAPGTTLDFRGATVSCGKIVIPEGVRVLTDVASTVDWNIDASGDVRYVAGTFASDGDVSKSGLGTVFWVGPCAKSGGTVRVREGRLVCSNAPSFSGKFYRLQYKYAAKKAGDSNDNGSIQFSEFSLYGTSGKRINEGGFTYNPISGTPTLLYKGYDGISDASLLSEREVAVWMPEHNQYFEYETDSTWDGSPLAAFDGNLTTKLRNTHYWESSSIIVFRLEDDAEDSVGFTFTTSDYPVRRPTEWKLEGSMDGLSWTDLAVREADPSLSATEKWLWRTNSTPDTAYAEYNGGFPYAFDSYGEGAGYAPFGSAAVSVDSGATLELDPNMTLCALRVDMRGAGSITGFSAAENGVLHLENAGEIGRGGEPLPLAVSSVANSSNLKTWKVHVDGRETDCTLKWNGSVLMVCPKLGLAVSIR